MRKKGTTTFMTLTESILIELGRYIGKSNSVPISTKYGKDRNCFFQNYTEASLQLAFLGPYSSIHKNGNKLLTHKLPTPSSRNEEDFFLSVFIFVINTKIISLGKIRDATPKEAIEFYLQYCSNIHESGNTSLNMPFKKSVSELSVESIDRRFRGLMYDIQTMKTIKLFLSPSPQLLKELKRLYQYYIQKQ